MEDMYIIIDKYKNESTLYYLYICRFTCQKCLKKEKGKLVKVNKADSQMVTATENTSK